MIDWNAVGKEASELLSTYLKIKSVNPPGNETITADMLAYELKKRGFSSKQYTSAPGRENLVARLRGNGSKKPILLYNHMDVVEADPSRWSCDPFSGDLRDGFVWGRGAIDMKGMGIMQLLAVDLLQKHNPDRTRDIIFFAAADEEEGAKFGTQWMIDNHWNEIEAEYNWDEGGFGLQDLFGPQPVFTVAVAEKRNLWVKLVAHEKPGHGGMPHKNSAINRLVRALDRILALNPKFELNTVTETMFKKISRIMPFPRSFLLKNLRNPLIFKLIQPVLAANPTLSAMFKNTLSITVLNAGGKENVIPERAEAILDIRLLPNANADQYLQSLKRWIADDQIEIQTLATPQKANVTDINTDFYRTLESVIGELVPGSIITPMLTIGTTDSCFFRQKGVNCYGLFPIIINPDDLARFHGIDERISIENLQLGTRIIYEVLSRLTE